ncbi:Por secretion system C-terminal sorting domain-containing protein [Flexibacter flexilis DSM 6793]|uniref:Por secretion system C-terminal sorting domain-containing protein n=1 Tax=Flexibacter flexilis DSM 6793 TaxID=927664 RepID=A0A1I1G4M7_9BACT|nr:M43 family zinc metalloprotease [Flexibacter flexilis]SFC06505.1 Por secretion system C-terminal sorting domain-containing protein [Flexibacter flexilis DSM 6793]
MKKKILTLLSLALIGLGSVQAQEYRRCGTDEEMQKLLEANPLLLQQLESQRLQQPNLQASVMDMADSTLVIPVVVHVVHNYGVENVSYDQVLDAIRILNEDFQLLNSDTSEVYPMFKSRIGNPNVEFRLAKKDPLGNCTMGVTRTVSELTNNADNTIKDVVKSWGTRYLNIWVVANIASGAGAYAHYPGSVAAQYEGIVCRASQFGSIGASGSSNLAARTLTHETGHFFNLAHTWGSSNTPGSASNCNIDDGVADTPNTIGVAGQNCNKTMAGCNAGETANVENYMDYSSCERMYTKGQVTRMRTALASSIGARSNLWTQSNRILTGTNNGYVTALCAPNPDFNINIRTACSGSPLSLTGSAYNVSADSLASVKYKWVLAGADSPIMYGQTISAIYSTPGVYPVMLVTSNSAGKDSITKEDYLTIGDGTPHYSAQLDTVESFEESSFPNFLTNVHKSWTVTSPEGLSFVRSTAASVTGEASLMIDNASLPDQTVSNIISSGFDLTSVAQPVYLSFKVAYARISSTSRDILKVYVSTNCGRTWSSALYNKSATNVTTPLSTVGTTYYTGTFTPTATQWRRELVNLGNYASYSNVRFKFEVTSRTGNRLFIDDVMISKNPLLGMEEAIRAFQVSVAPNPFDNAAQLNYTLPRPESVKVMVSDVLGRKIWEQNESQQEAGEHTLNLPTQIKQGVYFLQMEIAGQKIVQKIVKQ